MQPGRAAVRVLRPAGATSAHLSSAATAAPRPRSQQQQQQQQRRHASTLLGAAAATTATAPYWQRRRHSRCLTTLAGNPHIYVAPHPKRKDQYLFTLLPTDPPTPELALGTAPSPQPGVDDFVENADFLQLLHGTVREHAVHDPRVQAQAAAFASQAGSGTTVLNAGVAATRRPERRQQARGGMLSAAQANSTHNEKQQQLKTASSSAAGGASAQGGAGSAGRGGFIHVADERNPPDWGRIAWPEDILGSLEVDGRGAFVDGTGRYQASGTYRILTREGMLGLSEHLRERVRASMARIEGELKQRQ